MNVTGDELAALLASAATDPAALDELSTVTAVDGNPIDMQALLSGAADKDLESRLTQLEALFSTAEEDSVGAVDAEATRATVDEILQQDKYQVSDVPRPFEGLIDWLADRLRPLTDAVGDALGIQAVQLVLIAAVLTVAAVQLSRLAQRRLRATSTHGLAVAFLGEDESDPAELERRANLAERDGDAATAIRLRFVAGIIRLAARGVVGSTTTITTGGLRRDIDHPEFDRVATRFDRVAYGGHTPPLTEVELDREQWRAVQRDVGTRS